MTNIDADKAGRSLRAGLSSLRDEAAQEASSPKASIPIAKRERGSVENLCREIGFEFTLGMENPRLLMGFVKRLVLEVAEMRWQAESIAEKITGCGAPSTGSGDLLDKVLDMLNGDDVSAMLEQCARLPHL